MSGILLRRQTSDITTNLYCLNKRGPIKLIMKVNKANKGLIAEFLYMEIQSLNLS